MDTLSYYTEPADCDDPESDQHRLEIGPQVLVGVSRRNLRRCRAAKVADPDRAPGSRKPQGLAATG
jgi:hypothetical protein